jgi:hypothetical protein
VIPTVASRTVVAEESPAVLAWAARRPGWTVRLDEADLRLTVDTEHPATRTPLRIEADLHGYRAVPPAWRFVDPNTGQATSTVFPQPGTSPALPGSIFHPNHLICAPWNRLAFAELGGPHGDWGALTGWIVSGAGSSHAETLADMLSQIALHLAISTGTHP